MSKLKKKKKTKWRFILVTVLVLIFIVFFSFLAIVSRISHGNEIERVITANGWRLINYYSESQGPLKDIRSTTTYKIIYEKDGARKIAWFRAYNTVPYKSGDIREEWLFQK